MKQTQSDVALNTFIKLQVKPLPLKHSIIEAVNSFILPKGSYLTNFDPLTES